MAASRRRHAGAPEREMRQLLLLAMEREELVSVGYREGIFARRLSSMPVTDELRDLVSHALVWTWRDEEMHAVYLRGALLRVGSPSLCARAYVHQALGA